MRNPCAPPEPSSGVAHGQSWTDPPTNGGKVGAPLGSAEGPPGFQPRDAALDGCLCRGQGAVEGLLGEGESLQGPTFDADGQPGVGALPGVADLVALGGGAVEQGEVGVGLAQDLQQTRRRFGGQIDDRAGIALSLALS
jgi:hypothetical protein